MRRYARATGPLDGEVFAGMNITPLIDVMLVLIVVFILSMPALTHKVPIDLPQPGPVAPDRQVMHRLVLAPDGSASLDGVAMSDAGVGARLHALVADPASELVMRTDPATRYERFDQLLAVVKRAGVTRLGFEGNDKLARF